MSEMNTKVLVINKSYQPVSAIPWEKAMCLIFREKAEILAHYEGISVRSAASTHSVPAVIRLASHAKRQRHGVKFSRQNVFIRDRHTCQYCGSNKKSQLTFDHVIPRSRGGKTNWMNIVTACKRCNSAKADRLPHEANMRPAVEPRIPNIHENSAFMFSQEGIPQEWQFWLGSTGN